MATFQKADPAVMGILQDLMERYHQDLTEVGVRVGVLFAYAPRDKNGEPKGHAVKVHGRAAHAKVRIVSLADRVAGMPDAMVIVDGDGWQDRTETERLSILDHELEHINVIRDEETGAPKTDDAFRPCIKLMTHDVEVGLFDVTLRRWGQEGIEAKQVRQLSDMVQTVLDFETVEAA